MTAMRGPLIGLRGLAWCAAFFMAALSLSVWLLWKASFFEQASSREQVVVPGEDLAEQVYAEYRRLMNTEACFGRLPASIPQDEIEEEIAWRCGKKPEIISAFLKEAIEGEDSLLAAQASLVAGGRDQAVFHALRVHKEEPTDPSRKRKALEVEAFARSQTRDHEKALEAVESASKLYDRNKEMDAWIEAQCSLGLLLLAAGDDGGADALLWQLSSTLQENASIAPATQVTVYELQSATARAVGAYSTSKAALKNALAAKEAHLGSDHPDLVKMLGRVADLLGGEEGDAMSARHLAIMEKSHDADDPRLREALAKRGGSLFRAGKRGEALEVLQRATAGEPAPEISLQCLPFLGCLRRERGELDLAEQIFRRERELLLKQEAAMITLQRCDFNLAAVLEAAGKQKLADPIFAELADSAGLWRDDDSHALVWLHHHAVALRREGLEREAGSFDARVSASLEIRFEREKRFFLTHAASEASWIAEEGYECEAAEYLQLKLQRALRFQKEKGNPFPGTDEAIESFRGLLKNIGKSADESDAILAKMRSEAGLE